MTETPLAALLEAELERGRQARVSELGAVPLAWLAFPPVWTDRLARACGFPAGPLGLEELLRRAEAAGWCERRETEIRARTPALRLHLLVQLGELRGVGPDVRLEEVLSEADETLRAQLLAQLATTVPPDAVPEIHAAARQLIDPVAAADVMLAIATRDAEHAESVRLYLRGLLDQITDPTARAVRLLRLRELTIVPTQVWRREFLDFLAQVQTPTTVARLLRVAAPWLAGHDVSSVVQRLIDVLPAAALGDVAVATVWTGQAERALELAESIPDPRVRLHTIAELIPPQGRAEVDDLVRRCLPGDRPADLVLLSKVLEGVVETGRSLHVAQLTAQVIDAEVEAAPSAANVGALQRAAAAVIPFLERQEVQTLVQLSADLAARVPDPSSRASCLAGTAELARRPDLAITVVDDETLVEAARAVPDAEDRTFALIRVARLVPPDTRPELIDEALNLAAQLDEGATVVTAWVPDGVRDEILEELRRRLGFTTIRQLTGAMGWTIKGARRRGELVPEAMARWEELAAAADVQDRAHRAPAVLDERVSQLLAAGDTGQAFAWLDTAKSLAPLLLGEFETSVVANTRRIELYHRQELDRRRLMEFLPRAGQIHAFKALLDQTGDGPWALHYLGVGGVGKTTLIRHLTAQLAPERDVVTSRIDFDHINPDFPRRRPAQLLLELATELEPHAQERRQMTLFRQAYEQLQEINAAALPGTPPITVTDSRFASAVRTFGGFLQTLERPVVLILDTCEELEKFTPVGGRIEQLEAAFVLIEALHAAVPRLRVVLAGRRPLARAGTDWRLPAAAGVQESEVLLPARKPYLVVHEIRGFDTAEAEEFLRRVKGVDPSQELLDAILAWSPDTKTAVAMERTAVEWPDGLSVDGKYIGDPHEQWRERPRADVTRFNPFDLDHYANWLRAEPSLTAADITWTERDTYVESRIIGRLNHADVERLLPAVAAIGRFDRGMLRPAFDGDEQAFSNAWRELAATEWVDIQFDAALDTTFLEVDRRLRPRLESYYERSENRGLRLEAARRIGPGLARLCDERPLGKLGVDHVAAALRLLPADEAARLVDRLAWKVIEEAAWGWAERVVERILADQPALGRSEHPAAAGLHAMLASALVHLDPEREVAGLWDSIEEASHAHPDEERSSWLHTRATLGQGEAIQPPPLLAKTAARNEDLLESVLEAIAEEPDERRRQVLLGGLLTAVERRLDEEEAAGDRIRLLDPADLERAAREEPPAVRAYFRMLSARVLLLDARFDDAARAFGEAVGLVTGAGTDFSPWLLADWQPPDDLVERVWLEALRAPVPDIGRSALGPPPVPNDHLGTIDADRLASAALRRRLGREVVPAEELAAYERIDDLLETRRPVCVAHRATPPFFIIVAYGWLARGDAERARELLMRGEEVAIAGRDPMTVRRTAAARLDSVRRFRHGTWDWSLLVQLMDSGGAEQENALATATLAGPRRLAPPAVDLVVPETPPTVSDWFENHVLSQWERGVRGAFTGLMERASSEERRQTLESAIQVAGPRRVAELLLEEGELLALRRPEPATVLLDLAATLFEESGDSFGAVAATVTAALARARAGAQPSGVDEVRLRHSYEDLRREHSSSLPEWEALLPVVTDSGRAIGLPEDPVWQGWLHRLLLAMAWAFRPERLSRLAEAVAAAGGQSAELVLPWAIWPDSPAAAQPLGPVAAGGSEFPRLRGTPPSAPAGAPPVRRGSPSGFEPLSGQAPHDDDYGPSAQERRFSFSRDRLLGWIGRWGMRRRALSPVGVAIGIAAVALASSFIAAQSLARIGDAPRTSSPASTDILGLVAAGVLVVVTAGAAFMRWRTRSSIAVSYEKLDIGEIAAEGGGTLEFTPYAQQQNGLFGRVRRAAEANAVVTHVALSVPPGRDELPWEAPVLLGLNDVERPCWRKHPRGPISAPRGPWWEFRRARRYVVASDTWAGFIQETLGWPAVRREVFPLPPVSASRWNSSLLLVGTPVETSAGLRMQIASVTQEISTSEESLGGEHLVGHNSVPYALLGLVVVIGEPVEGLTRVDAEREQTSRLRRFAADAVDAGASAVLCLPSLPEDLARQVFRLLNRRLRRIRRGSWWDVVTTASRIRGIIGAAGTTDEERAAARELALEVTVWPA